MLKVKNSGQFKKDYKKCVKRGLDMVSLKSIVATLAAPEELPEKNKAHYLAGNYAAGLRAKGIQEERIQMLGFAFEGKRVLIGS